MMMNSFDLGGCCLARYGATTSYFASKTEQIMSRYRPIAPKPVVQTTAGLQDSVQNQQPQPCPSSFRASARTRKRNWEAASGAAVPSPPPPPPRPHKRAARGRAGAPDVHFEGGHNRLERSSAKSTVTSPALRHSDTSEEAVSPHCEISDSAASKCFTCTGPPFGYSSTYRPIAPKPVVQTTAGVQDSVQNQQPQPCPSSFRASARTRKRNWEAASGAAVPLLRPHKRAARGRAGASDVHFKGALKNSFKS